MDAPYEMKMKDKEAGRLIPTVKAFSNPSFIESEAARNIRIMCEFQEPATRFKQAGVRGTILFFGSARSMLQADYDQTMENIKLSLAEVTDETEKQKLEQKLAKFSKVAWMCPWAEVAEDLARRLTDWTMKNNKMICEKLDRHIKDSMTTPIPNRTDLNSGLASNQPLVVCTGGGPGIMEAANRGAASVKNGLSIGMGITLPFENGLNPFVSRDLAFEFHYFFTRKFWMMYFAKVVVVGPGGFGTMDEFFELLTLRQTGKMPNLPIVLLGKKYWNTVINWQAMADFGTISQQEVDELCFADTADEAFEFITTALCGQKEVLPHVSPCHTSKPGSPAGAPDPFNLS